jgi:hypothetical protein
MKTIPASLTDNASRLYRALCRLESDFHPHEESGAFDIDAMIHLAKLSPFDEYWEELDELTVASLIESVYPEGNTAHNLHWKTKP